MHRLSERLKSRLSLGLRLLGGGAFAIACTACAPEQFSGVSVGLASVAGTPVIPITTPGPAPTPVPAPSGPDAQPLCKFPKAAGEAALIDATSLTMTLSDASGKTRCTLQNGVLEALHFSAIGRIPLSWCLGLADGAYDLRLVDQNSMSILPKAVKVSYKGGLWQPQVNTDDYMAFFTAGGYSLNGPQWNTISIVWSYNFSGPEDDLCYVENLEI